MIERVGDQDDDCKFLGNDKLDEKLVGTWKEPGPFRRDLDELSKMIFGSFQREIEENRYEGTNCYWYNYVFVTKDHKILSCVESDFCDIDEESNSCELVDLDELSDLEAGNAPDKQALSYIEDHVKAIKPYLEQLSSIEAKKQAADMIRALVYKKE